MLLETDQIRDPRLLRRLNLICSQMVVHQSAIAVSYTHLFRFAKTYAVDDRSMVQRVRDDGVFFAEKRFEHTSVGIETGCIRCV